MVMLHTDVDGITIGPCRAGGREDADVRMLGSGRPFVLEVINPSKGHPSGEELRGIEAALTAANKWVRLREGMLCWLQPWHGSTGRAPAAGCVG